MQQSCSAHDQRFVPVSASVNALKVSVDPRIELLAAVQFHSGYDSVFHLLTKHDFAYKEGVKTHFAPFKDHPAIKRFDELSQRPFVTVPPFSFGAPPEVLLNVQDGFVLGDSMDKSQFTIARAGGKESLLAWIDELADFHRVSGFDAFWQGQVPFYTKIIEDTLSVVGDYDHIGELEAYYGVKQASYTIMLAPLFHFGGYGPKVDAGNGSARIFSIIGPRGVEATLPVFGTAEGFRHLQRHEFSHSFVNPVTEKFSKEVDRYSSLFPKAEAFLKKKAFGEWQECMNEHIIRAITVRLAMREDPAEGKWAYERESAVGLLFLDAILERLIEYESNRDKYPTFESFYLRLISLLDNF